MMATTIATIANPRMKPPKSAPVISASPYSRGLAAIPVNRSRRADTRGLAPPLDALELPRLLGDRHLGRQTLDAGSSEEAVAIGAAIDHVGRIRRLGDWAAMAEHDHVLAHAAGRSGPVVDPRDAIVKRQRRLRADRAARGQTHVANDDVGARLGHFARLLGLED